MAKKFFGHIIAISYPWVVLWVDEINRKETWFCDCLDNVIIDFCEVWAHLIINIMGIVSATTHIMAILHSC